MAFNKFYDAQLDLFFPYVIKGVYQGPAVYKGDLMISGPSNTDLPYKEIKSLGTLKRIQGSVYVLGGSALTSLGDLAIIEGSTTSAGNLTVASSKLTSLGNLKIVAGEVDLLRARVTDLGSLESIGKDLLLAKNYRPPLTNLKKVRDIHISGCNSLKELWVPRSLQFRCVTKSEGRNLNRILLGYTEHQQFIDDLYKVPLTELPKLLHTIGSPYDRVIKERMKGSE